MKTMVRAYTCARATMSVQFCSINATESDFSFDVPTMAWVDTKEYKRRGIQKR